MSEPDSIEAIRRTIDVLQRDPAVQVYIYWHSVLRAKLAEQSTRRGEPGAPPSDSTPTPSTPATPPGSLNKEG